MWPWRQTWLNQLRWWLTQLPWWLIQLPRCDHSRITSRSLWCGSHTTIIGSAQGACVGVRSSRRGLYGMSASSACVMGCLETGVSVIALCENAHRQKHLDIVLCERVVEVILPDRRSSRMRRCKGERSRPGGCVSCLGIFKDEVRQARAFQARWLHQLPRWLHQLPRWLHQLPRCLHQLPRWLHRLPWCLHQLPRSLRWVPWCLHQLPRWLHQLPRWLHELPRFSSLTSWGWGESRCIDSHGARGPVQKPS